jgi:hypothetical protein
MNNCGFLGGLLWRSISISKGAAALFPILWQLNILSLTLAVLPVKNDIYLQCIYNQCVEKFWLGKNTASAKTLQGLCLGTAVKIPKFSWFMPGPVTIRFEFEIEFHRPCLDYLKIQTF